MHKTSRIQWVQKTVSLWRKHGSKFNVVKKIYLEWIVVIFQSTKVFLLSFISSRFYLLVLSPLEDHLVHLLMCVWCTLSLQLCPTLCDPRTITRQVALSMGFSRQEYGVGCQALFQGICQTCIYLISGRFFTHWVTYRCLKRKYRISLQTLPRSTVSSSWP